MTETKRRGIFTDEATWGTIREPKGEYRIASYSTPAPSTNLLDMMPMAKERPKRNRQWEKGSTLYRQWTTRRHAYRRVFRLNRPEPGRDPARESD